MLNFRVFFLLTTTKKISQRKFHKLRYVIVEATLRWHHLKARYRWHLRGVRHVTHYSCSSAHSHFNSDGFWWCRWFLLPSPRPRLHDSKVLESELGHPVISLQCWEDTRDCSTKMLTLYRSPQKLMSCEAAKEHVTFMIVFWWCIHLHPAVCQHNVTGGTSQQKGGPSIS